MYILEIIQIVPEKLENKFNKSLEKGDKENIIKEQ